ncbi:hypothetical protein D3C74_412610 [compost metagenome]
MPSLMQKVKFLSKKTLLLAIKASKRKMQLKAELILAVLLQQLPARIQLKKAETTAFRQYLPKTFWQRQACANLLANKV